MKLVTIVGARPQLIKAAVLSRCIRNTPEIQEIIIHTGQHYDENMSRVFFEEMHIPTPHVNLGIGSGSHAYQTGRMLEGIEKILLNDLPNAVIVYGDTNSTLAGALAAAKIHIPVVHVEAGLRSFNRLMPEEINRILSDHLSDILFSPTQTASANLRKEGIPENRIYQVGDVMYDAVLYYISLAESKSKILQELGVEKRKYILGTVHRTENTNSQDKLKAILKCFNCLSEFFPVILPLHPRTRQCIKNYGLMNLLAERVIIIEPVGYFDMLMLEKNAELIVTDSGGIQKEAFFFKVPCVTLREETEWVETVDSGWNHLFDPEILIGTLKNNSLTSLFHNRSGNSSMDNLYGDGKAGEKIVDILKCKLAFKRTNSVLY